jgi:hypothetical protein
MSFSTMIYPPPAPPSFFTISAAKISSLPMWHKVSTAFGLGCSAKALYDIKAKSGKNPEVNKYLYRAVAGLVTTAALACIGAFGGSVALSALGCAAVGYTFCAVYRIGQADPSLKGLVSRAYFGLAAVALIPAIGAGFGVIKVIGSSLFSSEVTICMPFIHQAHGA